MSWNVSESMLSKHFLFSNENWDAIPNHTHNWHINEWNKCEKEATVSAATHRQHIHSKTRIKVFFADAMNGNWIEV